MKPYIVKSWNDDLKIGDEIFTYDPRMNEDRQAFGHKHMERYVASLYNDKGHPLQYVKVKCEDLNQKRIYIFTN